MAEAHDNSDRSGEVEIQPAPFTRIVEVISAPTGPVIRETTKTMTGKTVVFLTPKDADALYKMALERVAVAGRAVLLPPGTVVPMPEKPEQN